MVSCYACVLMIISSSNFVVSHCSCLYGGIITHVAVFDCLTLDFLCLTLQAMVFDLLYCLLCKIVA